MNRRITLTVSQLLQIVGALALLAIWCGTGPL
jgi:hypothetical protein